ncbi:hypothetical protein D9M68_964810 [compost metagenome]
MGFRRPVGQGQSGRVEDPDLATHGLEQPGGLEGEQAAVGALAQRPVEDQEPGAVLRGLRGGEAVRRRYVEQVGAQCRELVVLVRWVCVVGHGGKIRKPRKPAAACGR